MKIKLLTISKEDDKHAHALFLEYAKRLTHYINFEAVNIKPVKTSRSEEQKRSDAESLLKRIAIDDHVILLDEQGKEMSSAQFSDFIAKKMNAGIKSICFIIGGAYGFDRLIYERSHAMIALSKMTLPHQLAKAVFMEQLYRSFTIIRNEKYHH